MGERPSPAPEGATPPERKDAPKGIEEELGIGLGLPKIDVKKRARDEEVVRKAGLLGILNAAGSMDKLSGKLNVDEAASRIQAPGFDEGPAALAPRVALGPEDRTPLDIGPLAISVDRADVNLGDRAKPEDAPKEPVAAPKRAEKVDYGKVWPKEKDRVLLADAGGFVPGEKAKVDGNRVAIRNESGIVMTRLDRGTDLTLTGPLQRFEVGDEVFTKVMSGKREGYIAERYVKTLEQRRDTVAQLRSTLTVADDDRSLRQVVVYQLDNLFGQEPKTPKLRAQKEGLYAKWDAAYQKIDRSGLTGSKREQAVQDAYRSLFGNSRNIFEDGVKMEMELSVGSNFPGKMLTVGGETYEDAKVDAALAQLGDQIGTYYGVGRMSAAQIRQAFDIKDLPRNWVGGKQVLWGEPGSRIFFSYADGKLYFYPPEGKTEKQKVNLTPQEVAQYEARTGKTADATRARMVEKPMSTGGVKEPVKEEFARVRERRTKEYLASLDSSHGQS